MFCENEKSIHPTTHTCATHSKPNMSQAADGYGQHGIAQTPKNRSDGRTNASSYMNGVDIQSESTSSGKTVIPLSKSTSLKTFSDRQAIPKNLFTASYRNLASQIEEDAPFSVKMNESNAIDDSKTSNDSNTINASAKAKAKANDRDSKNVNTKKIAVAPATISTASASASIPATQSSSAIPLVPSRVQNAGGGGNGGPGRVRYKKNDSESSSGSDLIDLTTSSSKKNVAVSDMYNDDIDYMNNYLKSLPDYNELNRKISNEQQKCEDIYDRLLCINSSLKSNLLPKSNSYHSICTASTKPYQSTSARGDNNNNNNKNSSAATKNKIIRSSSSSIVNQNLINNPDKFGAGPIAGSKQSTAMIKSGPNQAINTKTVAKVQQQQLPDTNKDFNEMYKFRNPLPKSASSTNLHRSNSIKELNDFWSENLAKSNQQKLGWNYSRIMANRSDNGNASPNSSPNPSGNAITNTNMGTVGPNASNASVSNNNDRAITKLISNKSDNYTPMSGYKLQKNMSLSQLDQKIRQNVSREELYNLICNNEPVQQQKPAESTKHLNHMAGNKNNITYNNNLHRTAAVAESTVSNKSKPNQTAQHTPHNKPQNVAQTMQCTSTASGPANPLSKSFSQQSMPSFFQHFTKMKSPKKNSIPTLFKPLCKSSSNTHVFNNQTRDAPQETFTPKFLMKSSSSSSIFNSNGLLQKYNPLNKFNSSFGNAKNVNNGPSGYVTSTSIAPVTFNNHHHHHHNNKISKNNELLKTQNKNMLHEMAAKSGAMATSTPTASGSVANKQNSDNFYVKQNYPEFCKATVSYTSTKSNVHMPTYGNLPSLSNPAPATGSIINKPNTNSR